MGTNGVPLIADLFCSAMKRDLIASLSDDKQAEIIQACKDRSGTI